MPGKQRPCLFVSIFLNVSTNTQTESVRKPAASVPAAAMRSQPDPVHYDPPLQHKVGLLVTLACVGGFALGIYAERFDSVFWKLSGALVVGLGALWWLSGWWVSEPLTNLARQAERVSRTGLTSALRSLPIGRHDEIGRIAKSLHTMGVAAARSHMQAKSLRSTIDQRVVDATRRATQELSRLVMRDALTDLGNRRFLDENLDPLFTSARTSGTDLACVMMDLDHFKQVNDELGHDAGDHLLVFLAGLIRATSRQDDLVVRLGGDEFLLVMPGTDSQRAQEVAMMICKLFTRQAYTMFPSARMLDLSYGIASIPADPCPDAKALMRIADQRLYDRKRSRKP
jgi:diguanylate cyclase (GGDEF)-like protein